MALYDRNFRGDECCVNTSIYRLCAFEHLLYRAVASLGFWLRRGTSVDNSKIYSPSLLFSAMFHEYIFNIFYSN